MSIKSFEELLQGYLQDELTKDQLQFFLELLRHEENMLALRNLVDDMLLVESVRVTVYPAQEELIFKNIMAVASETAVHDEKLIQLPQRNRLFVFVRVAAVAIVILLSAGIYLNTHNKATVSPIKSPGWSVTKPLMVTKAALATLRLADGSVISLDDTENDGVIKQDGIKVIKLKGRLAYSHIADNGAETNYNTITTPKGGQYQVELADGTSVWLNAASSIYFPTDFTGHERRVEITGEAYFEVAKNADKQFIVVANGAEVRVFGTHFNVMAYKDENELKTTLLEGSIKFVYGSSSHVLVPGQQSRLAPNGQLSIVDDVDVNAIVAWKNGLFHFENAGIETIMKQLSRWYDVQLVYQNKEHFQHQPMGNLLHADIPRNTKLADVLKVLEIAGGGKFEVVGKNILIR